MEEMGRVSASTRSRVISMSQNRLAKDGIVVYQEVSVFRRDFALVGRGTTGSKGQLISFSLLTSGMIFRHSLGDF